MAQPTTTAKQTTRTSGWTRAQRNKLNGIRSLHEADPPDVAPSADDAWTTLRDHHQRCQERLRSITAQENFRDGLDALLSTLSHPEAPASLDFRLELYRLGYHMNVTPPSLRKHAGSTDHELMRALVGLWVGVEGVPFALEMYDQKADFGFEGATIEGDDAWITLKLISPEGTVWPTRIRESQHEWSFWPALRSQVALLDEEALRQAREAAAPRYRQLCDSTEYHDLRQRDLYAFVFSRDPEWAEEQVRALLTEEQPTGETAALLASLTDPQLALELANTMPLYLASFGGRYALDVVESLGAEAAPVLRVLIDAAPSATDRSPFEAALELAETLKP